MAYDIEKQATRETRERVRCFLRAAVVDEGSTKGRRGVGWERTSSRQRVGWERTSSRQRVGWERTSSRQRVDEWL